jgi:hypothetical protein
LNLERVPLFEIPDSVGDFGPRHIRLLHAGTIRPGLNYVNGYLRN